MSETDVSRYEATIQTFLELEEERLLFDWTVRGVPIWEWLRCDIQRAILQQSEIHSENPLTSEYDYRSYLRGLGLWAKNAVSRNPLLAEPAERLYWGHQRRKRLDDGYWWDIYCDPIHEAESASYLHVEVPHELRHLKPARTENLRYLDFIVYTGSLMDAIPVAGVSLTANERREIEDVETGFEETFDVEFDLVSKVEGILSRRQGSLPLYRRLLRRVDPDVVVVVVSYGKTTFIEACKDEGIPVVELQHGGFGPNHPGYAFPGDRTKDTFPDYLFTFGEFWRDSVDLPIPRENVIPVGYAHLEREKEKYDVSVGDGPVVFLSQWSIGEELTRVATEFAEVAPDRDVVVKLHPAEYTDWRELYPWLEDAPLTVVAGEEPPLYELLATSAVQVGVYTTVIYEGLNFGLDTYLLDLPGVSRMGHLVERGGATLVRSAEELQKALEEGIVGGTVDVDYFFEPDPVEKFEEALETVLEREA